MSDFDWPVDSWVDPTLFTVAEGTSLAVRLLPGDSHPFVLVHGLASNALLWRGVAEQLNSHGHPVASVDLRGHGRSEKPEDGYSTASAARDLGSLVTSLGWSSSHPIAVGQSWGGNVVLRAAHDDRSWGGVCAVDGGWIHLGRRFDSFDECWAKLAPPDLSERNPADVIGWIGAMVADWPGLALEAVAGNLEVRGGRVHNRLARNHHQSILHSLWADDPAHLYEAVAMPVHLMVAGSTTSPDVDEALSALPDATVSWHPSAHHDIHLQHPQVVTEHLLALLARVEGS